MWGVKAPKRVSFIWTGAFGKILTCDNLMRRGMFWAVGVACVRATGRRGHLLLHCVFASELWGFVFKTFGIYWVIPTRVLSLRNFDACLKSFHFVPLSFRGIPTGRATLPFSLQRRRVRKNSLVLVSFDCNDTSVVYLRGPGVMQIW